MVLKHSILQCSVHQHYCNYRLVISEFYTYIALFLRSGIWQRLIIFCWLIKRTLFCYTNQSANVCSGSCPTVSRPPPPPPPPSPKAHPNFDGSNHVYNQPAWSCLVDLINIGITVGKKTYIKKKSWSGEMWNKRRFGYNTLSQIIWRKERKKERKKGGKNRSG